MHKILFYIFLLFVILTTRPWQLKYSLNRHIQQFKEEEKERKARKELKRETRRINREANLK